MDHGNQTDRPDGPARLDISDQVVLVVDDYALLATDMAITAAELGFGTLTATSGKVALGMIENRPAISILVVDLMLDGITDGMDVMRKARELRPDLAVILVSVFARPDVSLLPDRVVFLPKPHHSEALHELLIRFATDQL